MDLKNLGYERKKKLKGGPDLSTIVYGKVPPQARDLEEGVLGAILTVKNAFDAASEIIDGDCFYVDAHIRIFKAMEQLNAHYKPIDILTVVEQLRKNDELDLVGGPYYVTTLTNGVTSSAHIDTHSKIIYQKYVQRELIRMAGELLSEAYEDSTDAFDLMDSHSVSLNTLAMRNSGKSYTTIQEHLTEELNSIIEKREKGETLTGAPFGIITLDEVTQGMQPGDLILLAARPAVGKSAVAANIARLSALHPVRPCPVGIFSLEMSSRQWVNRILAAQSEIDRFKTKRGDVDDKQIEHLQHVIYHDLADAKIFLDDTASLKMSQLKAKARQMVKREGVRLIIVDYLQLVSSDENKNIREQEVSKIGRDLKQLAKELLVPIIALSQLSRAGDNQTPKLSNLRESGALEQDADMVIFLVPAEEEESGNPELKDGLLITVAKYRDGAAPPIKARFVKEVQKIFISEDEYKTYRHYKETGFKPLKSFAGYHSIESDLWEGNAID